MPTPSLPTLPVEVSTAPGREVEVWHVLARPDVLSAVRSAARHRAMLSTVPG
jgi:hypothetical protein